jgi:origin recognition complex subunit 3
VLRHVQDALLSVTRPTRILLLYILQGKLETTEFFQELMLVLGTLSPKQTGEMNASVRAILQQHGQDASWTPTVNVPSVYAAYFRRTLQSYTSLTGHELFYYANVQLLQQTFHPPHVPSIHTALVHPSHYLQCTCCNSTLSAKLPDVSIAFRLYLECSKFINLQDWFEAFSSVLERTSTPPSKADRAQRFCRAVIEMEWLGMIKSTSRRADHVMRILWDIE